MRIRVTLKDPDALSDAVSDAYAALAKPAGISKSEWESIREERANEARFKIERLWMAYGEYLDVEFDLDAETAEVIRIRNRA